MATSFRAGSQVKTKYKGFYAAGDCVDHVYRQRLPPLVGCQAAIEAERWLAERIKFQRFFILVF